MSEHDGATTLSKPAAADTGINKKFYLSLPPTMPAVTVTHRLQNDDLWPIECTPRRIMQLAAGVVGVLSLSPGSDGLLPDRSLSAWPSTDLVDVHITYDTGAARFLHDDHGDGRLKIGRDGWFGVGTEDIPSHKSFTHAAGTEYSDTGASAEVYTDPDLFEIGRVPPLSTADPGDSLEHTVTGRS